ncbi:hypothetical protein Tco_0196085 [Tanacetum coccineum]
MAPSNHTTVPLTLRGFEYGRSLVPKCVAMGESRPVSDIGGFDIPETVSVVSGGTYTVRDDVISKRQCIQRSDFNPLDCGPGSSVSMPELPGYSCIVDSGVSSMRSNAESASYVITSSCLGDRILDTDCIADPDIGVAISVGKQNQ